VLDYDGEVVSDLSALHHVADWRTLDSVTWCVLVERLPYYQGAVRARAVAEASEERAEVQKSAGSIGGDAMLQQLANEGWLERK